MHTEQLKNSILQRAIEGKLVEQRAEEGTAAELLREIKAEKARLVKEGKLKKEKPLPEIRAEEIPFAIPESWVWVRLNEVIQIINGDRGKNYPAKAQLSHQGNIPFISAVNIDNGTISEENLLFVSEERYHLLRSGHLHYGDLVLCIRGSLGKNGRFPFQRGAIASSLVILRSYIDEEILYYFLSMYLNTWLFISEIRRYDNGTAQPNLGARDLAKFLVPLPSLAEQKRIVAKIEELLPCIERYGKAHDELTALNEKFPDAMKKSVLQYAIEGKLVEQRPEEGTAKELLAAIKAEKRRLVKEGKLKKEKPLPEIKAEEIPFEIPKSWEWVRLGEICFPFRYGTSEKSSKKGRIPVLRMGNIQHGSIDYSDLVYTNNEEDIEKYQLDCNDLLFNRTNSREWVGKTALYRGERPAIFAGYLIQVRPVCVDSEYLNYVMNSEYERNYCKHVKSDGINQSNVNAQKLSKFIVPLPPLAEQKRIVAKIEELLACCERLGNETTA